MFSMVHFMFCMVMPVTREFSYDSGQMMDRPSTGISRFDMLDTLQMIYGFYCFAVEILVTILCLTWIKTVHVKNKHG